MGRMIQVLGPVFCKPGLVGMKAARAEVFDVVLCGRVGGAFTSVTLPSPRVLDGPDYPYREGYINVIGARRESVSRGIA